MRQLAKNKTLALLPAHRLCLLARCWPSSGAAEGESSSTRKKILRVRRVDTTPANRRIAQAALWPAAGAGGDLARAVVDLEPLVAPGQPSKAPAISAAAPQDCAACRCSDSNSAR